MSDEAPDLPDLERVTAHIDDHFDTHLAMAQEWVRQRSVSADGIGIVEMAELVLGGIESLGGHGEIVPTKGHPVVFGEVDVGAPRTLLVYCLYDVQPVEGEDWISPPFDAAVVDLPDVGPSVIGRGIMNSKGPLAGLIAAAQSLQAVTGSLPVNLKFAIEGEEELGSPHYAEFVQGHRAQLQADAALFPFYSQDSAGKVLMYLGVKGMLFLELIARGGDWGGPATRAVHGMNAGWFHSPAWALVQALSTMLSTDQRRILVDGLYDQVAPATGEDRDLLRHLGTSFSVETQLREAGVSRFKHDLPPAELLETFLFEPGLNIDGMVAGHHGEGMKTVLPHEARAKIDVRLVPGMDPDVTARQIRDHLDRHGFSHVALHQIAAYPGSKGSASDRANAPLLEIYRSSGVDLEVWPLVSGSAPLYVFTQTLGIPLAIGGLGHGGRQHAPNEYATVEGMRLFEHSMAAYLQRLANS